MISYAKHKQAFAITENIFSNQTIQLTSSITGYILNDLQNPYQRH
jgi:hypothetical protein